MSQVVFRTHENTLTAQDGYQLHTQAWLPDASPRGMVIYVHGYGEHLKRTTELYEALLQANYGVYALDQRHHGRNQGERGLMKSLQPLVDDLKTLVDDVQAQHGDAKYYLMAHSMGTLVTLNALPDIQARLAGVVLCGTAVDGAGNLPPGGKQLIALMARLLPRFPAVRFNPENAKRMTRDTAKQQETLNDPLVYNGHWYASSVHAMLASTTHIEQHLHKISVPLLLIHGEADTVTPLSGAQRVHDTVASKDKTLRVYPQMRHELFRELDREQVFNDVTHWLNER